MFSNQIQWDIFNGLYNLTKLSLNNNAFTGQINWTIIADLHNNGKLKTVTLENNQFTGYVDFSWIDGTICLQLDTNIQCMYNRIG